MQKLKCSDCYLSVAGFKNKIMDFKSKTLQDIKDFTGIDFETCDYFQNQLQDKSLFFDIILKQPMWLSNEFDKLKKFSTIYKIEMNYAGYKRVRFYKKSFET